MDFGSITGLATGTLPAGFDPAIFNPAWIGIFMAFLAVFVVIAIVIYVYSAFAWMTIAKKLNYKNSWLAWIPFANFAMILQLGGFAWGLIFLMLIPILGWIALAVLGIIATWRIFEKRKYPGALSLITLGSMIPWIGIIAGIGNLIVLGLVAWSDKK
jgi:hypothetical protein